jgi:hypothetical protein
MSQQTDAECMRGLKIMGIAFVIIFAVLVAVARTIVY